MELRAVHPTIGVEVVDLDVTAPTSASTIALLRRAFAASKLLVFRCRGPLPPERQVDIASWFAPQDGPRGEELVATVLDNADNAGRVELRFHSDLTFLPNPVDLITLHALELPRDGTRTCLVDGVAAWATLPVSMHEELATLTLRHREHSADFPEFDGLSHVHPLRLEHPRTGECVLFLTDNHAERVEELDEQASDVLIARLKAHLYAPANIYEHRWKPFDLLVWDNLALQHGRPADADPAAGRRRMQRVSVGGPTIAELMAVMGLESS